MINRDDIIRDLVDKFEKYDGSNLTKGVDYDFTYSDLMKATKASKHKLRKFIGSLIEAGEIEVVRQVLGQTIYYKIK